MIGTSIVVVKNIPSDVFAAWDPLSRHPVAGAGGVEVVNIYSACRLCLQEMRLYTFGHERYMETWVLLLQCRGTAAVSEDSLNESYLLYHYSRSHHS